MEQGAISSYYTTTNSITSPTSTGHQSYVFHDVYNFPFFSRKNTLKNLFHKSIFFIVPTLIGLQQLMYQGRDQNPFESHPNTMRVALCAALIYFLAYSKKLTFSAGRFSTDSVAWPCMVCSGLFMVASLASIFAPDSYRPLFYAVAVLISASQLMWYVYKKIMNGCRELYYRIIRWCVSILRRLRAPDYLRARAPILPIVNPYSARGVAPRWLSRSGLRVSESASSIMI